MPCIRRIETQPVIRGHLGLKSGTVLFSGIICRQQGLNALQVGHAIMLGSGTDGRKDTNKFEKHNHTARKMFLRLRYVDIPPSLLTLYYAEPWSVPRMTFNDN